MGGLVRERGAKVQAAVRSEDESMSGPILLISPAGANAGAAG